jgi:hypothetical protein
MNAKQASELVGDDRVMMNGRVGRVLQVEHNAVSICWDGRETGNVPCYWHGRYSVVKEERTTAMSTGMADGRRSDHLQVRFFSNTARACQASPILTTPRLTDWTPSDLGWRASGGCDGDL